MDKNKLKMKKYILITGATSGIGLEMAKILAQAGHHLVITGRNKDKLENAATILRGCGNGSIAIYTADLASAEQAMGLYESIKRDGLYIQTLVNNAGAGSYGDFVEMDLKADLDMIELNIASVVVLCKLFARDMAAGGGGRIMNVASLLSFLPFPYYSVYSATKAFILAFSETLAAELADSNVVITTLCPGPVDTPFNTLAMWNTNAYKANKPMPAAVVAQQGVALLLQGTGKKIVGFNNWFISNLPRITPDFIMMKIKKHLAAQRK